MSDAFQLVKRVVSGDSPLGGYRWAELLAAMRTVIAVPPTREVEQLLLDVLRFEGQVCLTPTSVQPHSMSPEEMLKSLAIQGLEKWTGPTHLLDILRVQSAATSPVLAAIARAVGQRGVAHATILPIRSEGGRVFLPNQRVRRPTQESRELQLSA